MLRYIHFGERTVMVTKGEYIKHHLTFLFGLILSHKVLFLRNEETDYRSDTGQQESKIYLILA